MQHENADENLEVIFGRQNCILIDSWFSSIFSIQSTDLAPSGPPETVRNLELAKLSEKLTPDKANCNILSYNDFTWISCTEKKLSIDGFSVFSKWNTVL